MAWVKSSIASFQFPVRSFSIPREQNSSAVDGNWGACVSAGIRCPCRGRGPRPAPDGFPVNSLGARGYPNHRHLQFLRQLIHPPDLVRPDLLKLVGVLRKLLLELLGQVLIPRVGGPSPLAAKSSRALSWE